MPVCCCCPGGDDEENPPRPQSGQGVSMPVQQSMGFPVQQGAAVMPMAQAPLPGAAVPLLGPQAQQAMMVQPAQPVLVQPAAVPMMQPAVAMPQFAQPQFAQPQYIPAQPIFVPEQGRGSGNTTGSAGLGTAVAAGAAGLIAGAALAGGAALIAEGMREEERRQEEDESWATRGVTYESVERSRNVVNMYAGGDDDRPGKGGPPGGTGGSVSAGRPAISDGVGLAAARRVARGSYSQSAAPPRRRRQEETVTVQKSCPQPQHYPASGTFLPVESSFSNCSVQEASCARSKSQGAKVPMRKRQDAVRGSFALREWFETHVLDATGEAREASLGRTGTLPCAREVVFCSERGVEDAVLHGVCLVTQCSLDRLGRLRAQLLSWEGEVSAAVFVDAHAGSLAAAAARAEVLACCEETISLRRDAQALARPLPWTVTLVYRLADHEVRCPAYDQLYPVNTLRNAALAAARSALVFLLDVDFLPSAGLQTRLQQACQGCGSHDSLLEALHGASRGRNPAALVIPAFEVRKLGDALDWDEQKLREACEAGEAAGFHVAHFPRGHRATDFERWRRGPEPRQAPTDLNASTLAAYHVEYEEHFEPYIIVARSRVPKYDERFRGYGLNKISHLYELNVRGFEFLVMDHRDSFVVAEEHAKSPSWQLMYGPNANGPRWEPRARIATHYEMFKAELHAATAANALMAPKVEPTAADADVRAPARSGAALAVVLAPNKDVDSEEATSTASGEDGATSSSSESRNSEGASSDGIKGSSGCGRARRKRYGVGRQGAPAREARSREIAL